jgi:translation initiation factor 4A
LCVGEEEEFITNWEETVENFDDMGLKEGVLRGIYGYGFVKPSPIQQKGILPVIQGKDTIAQVINIFNNKSIFNRPNLEQERLAASQFQFCS